MKETYSVKLRCATCGRDDQFEFNEDKSFVKCTFCNREYPGGIDELIELNDEAIDEVKDKIAHEAEEQIYSDLKKVFNGSKYIKFK